MATRKRVKINRKKVKSLRKKVNKRNKSRKRVKLTTKNLNEIPKEELKRIPKLGKKIIHRILKERPFNRLEDLYDLEGFGDKAYMSLKHFGIYVDNVDDDNICELFNNCDNTTLKTTLPKPTEESSCDMQTLIKAVQELSAENKNLQQEIRECRLQNKQIDNIILQPTSNQTSNERGDCVKNFILKQLLENLHFLKEY